MATETADDYAARLVDWRAARRVFTSVFEEGATPDLAFAYAVQKRYIARLSPRQDRAGFKVGLTTARMQAMVGVDQPIAGVVLAERLRQAPAEVAAKDFIRLGIEGEVAVRIGPNFPKDLSGLSLAGVAAGLDAAAAAFELIDDAGADYTRLTAPGLVADNVWNAGLVLGEPVDPRTIKDFAGLNAEFRKDGQVIDRGTSAQVLGDPLKVIVWLADQLARNGDALRPGDWVSTGSIVPTHFVGPGERYAFVLEGLPPTSLTIR